MGKTDTLNQNLRTAENDCSKDMGAVHTRQGKASGSLQSEDRRVKGREL